MLRRFSSLALAALGLGALATAFAPGPQDDPLRGPRKTDPRWHALTGATVIPEPGQRIENATVVIRDGRIQSVAANGAVPDGARVWDYTGLVIHAGFIEPYLPVEVNDAPEDEEGRHWQSDLVVPERSVLDGGKVDGKTAKALRELGFTAALLAPEKGILGGTTALVALGEDASEAEASTPVVIADDLHDSLRFQTASWGSKGQLRYPTSQMGAIALARQTLMDAERHATALGMEQAPLEPLQPALAAGALATCERPMLFVARDELQLLRAARLGAEFGRDMVAVGTGTEFRRLGAVADTGLALALPLAFPEAPDVSTHAKAEGHSLRALAGWEQAPTNLARLLAAGVDVALTTARLEKRADFTKNLEEAMKHGVGADDALRALTVTPARMLGVEGQLGRVAPGMLAHLVVRKGEPFPGDDVEAEEKKGAEIRDLWIAGRRFRIHRAPAPEVDGVWTIDGALEPVVAGAAADARFELEDRKTLRLVVGDETVKGQKVRFGRHHVHFHLAGGKLGVDGVLSGSAMFEGEVLSGSLTGPDGRTAFFRAVRSGDLPDDDDEDGNDEGADDGSGDDAAASDDDDEAADDEASEEDEPDDDAIDLTAPLPLPFGAYGRTEPAPRRTVLFSGATVWTAAEDGILEDADVLIEDGKIVYVGPAGEGPTLPEGADTYDATGLHITPGIIDCHSHTGISGGVNEVGRRVTCEVRIADVIDPDSISFYRQLAGGTTAANQLHGSANAIGGQNSVVKLRWGCARPDDMRLEGAKPGVKFALGENPKRVAAGTDDPEEYPQTRMGVEALIRDRLMAGVDYDAAMERYAALSEDERARTLPPRRDLELEAMAEIVKGERWIHSHSYRQDEILMLARIAQEFGFKIGTFQHVLEGYKVADAVAEAAVGASTFSDWWAYKFEVVDAIPHNAALMTEVGVNVSINSDSNEHARRLNTEAGKAVKYGGLAPNEALKLVTLNPAIQLGVGDRVGSLEEGKDADLAIWNGDPLSYASRCLSTWVDGAELYSDVEDRRLAAAAEAERQRIIQKLLARDVKPENAEKKGEDEDAPRSRELAMMRAEMEALWRSGNDPSLARPGVCGCFDVLYEEALRRAEEAEGR